MTTTEGEDYTSQDNTDVQVAASSSATIDIPIVADNVADCGEEFTVTITGPVGSVTAVTVTITECKYNEFVLDAGRYF